MSLPKVGDTIDVLHDCWDGTGRAVRHTTPITITRRKRLGRGWRLSTVRCDGTAMEWVVNDAGEEYKRA